MADKFLRGAAYALGEEQRDYSSIACLFDADTPKDVPVDPETAGLGSFFVTKDIFGRAAFSIGNTLLLAGIAPGAIDHVIVCAGLSESDFFTRNRQVGYLLENWKISPKTVRGIGGSGCVDVLSALELACSMLELRRGRNVLVVGMENASSHDAERLAAFGLKSDAAVSVIISDQPGYHKSAGVFEVMSHAIVSRADEMITGMHAGAAGADRDFVRKSLADSSIDMGAVSRLFGNNVFLPLKEYRESLVGFTKAQMYLDNVRRIGHCLKCDPLINLVDFGFGRAGDHYVLYSEADGHKGCLVLRQRTPAERSGGSISTGS